jgi:hypothetical protein
LLAAGIMLASCNAPTKSVVRNSMRESWISNRAREIESSGADRSSAAVKAQQEWDNLAAAENAKSASQTQFESDLARATKK